MQKNKGGQHVSLCLTKPSKMKILCLVIILLSLTYPAPTHEVDNTERKKEVMLYIAEQRKQEYIKFVLSDIEKQAGITLPEGVNTDHIVYMYETAQEFDLPIEMIFRLINQESEFCPQALSPKGAYGYLQLMPGTYWMYHQILFGDAFIEDHNPYKNIFIGIYYLSKLYGIWNDWPLALASYNAGIGKVRYYQGIPPYRETRNFINIILS